MQIDELPSALQQQLANSKKELAQRGLKPSPENVALINGSGTAYQATHLVSRQQLIFTEILAIPGAAAQIMEAPLFPEGTIRIIAPIGSLSDIHLV